MRTRTLVYRIFSLIYLIINVNIAHAAQANDFPIESMAINGEAKDGQGVLQFIARLLPPPGSEDKQPIIYTFSMDSNVTVEADRLTQITEFRADVKSGKLEELVIDVAGNAELLDVTGDGIESWSQRQLANSSSRQLVIKLKEPMKSGGIPFKVTHEQRWEKLPATASPIAFNLADPGLLHGQLSVKPSANVSLRDWQSSGLKTIDSNSEKPEQGRDFITDGQTYSLTFTVAPPTNSPSRLIDFQLTGQWQPNAIEFKLTGEIVVDDPDGADLLLLSGDAAFTKLPNIDATEIVYRNGAYRFVSKKAGRFPIDSNFVASVNKQPGKRSVKFGLASSALRPVRLLDMPASPQRVELGSAPVEAKDNAYLGYLPPTGAFNLQWTDPAWQDDPADQAKLFFTAENVIDTVLSVGLLRQSQTVKINVLQGAMSSLKLWLDGDGEITSVTGPAVLNWEIGQPEPQHSGQRAITIRFNRPQTETTQVEVALQTALGEFPFTVAPARLTVDEAIRTGGFWSLRNAGAVELSPQSVQNLAQIAPEFLPPSPQRESAKQVLAYRFAGNQYSLGLLVDNILPEIAVSEILLYRLEENDQSISAEFECDIRRAPVRDFHISLPAGYSLAQVDAPALADYFVADEVQGQSELRLVFSQPLEGKRVIRLQLERNDPLPETGWALPYLAPLGVKSVRGHIGVAAGPGLRLSVDNLTGLAEQVTTYFPQRINDLRLALRLRQPDWSGQLGIEKLSQSVQAESLHLITLAEGALYGSTVINYAIGDAPVESFRIRIPAEYQNINFSGPNVRSWKVLENNEYLIDLQRAQTGPYTLLVTFESKFTPQGARLSFGGVEPLGVESEQGYVVVTSDFPFDISSIEQSTGLLMLEPNEIPAEFRLLYESQVLAAYQYTRRPFTLSFEVAPFQQGQTVNQVVDYTELSTQVSGDGELLTTAVYQLKSKGHPHFRMTLPANSKLWNVTVADQKVTPAADGEAILIPLPAGREADTPIPVRLQWASRAADPQYLKLVAPNLTTPALMVNWSVSVDPGFSLRFEGGDLQPSQVIQPTGAWSWFRDILFGDSWLVKIGALACVMFLITGVICLTRFKQHNKRTLLLKFCATLAIVMAIVGGVILLMTYSGEVTHVSTLDFTTPLEQSSTPMTISISNRPVDDHGGNPIGWIGLGISVLALGFCTWRNRAESAIPLLEIGAWLLMLWSALHLSASPIFFGLVILAVMVRYLYVPARSMSRATAAVTIITLALLGFASPQTIEAKSIAPPVELTVVAEASQRIAVENDVANVSATLVWDAADDATIPLLSHPAVLQDIDLPANIELRLDKANNAELFANKAGRYTLILSYRVPVIQQGNERYIELPLTPALTSRGTFSFPGKNVVVECKEAVSFTTDTQGDQTQTKLVFRPSPKVTLRWSPETRDVSKEERVYFAESYEVYQPMAGIVEGSHQIEVRPAQGVIEQLTIATPDALTITSVDSKNLNNWRFDPEKQVVELFFQPGHSSNFNVAIRSQYTSQSLPYQQAVRPLSLPEASSQISLVALATDSEVHIGEINLKQNSAINLEDFPLSALELLKHPGNTPVIRRAYRWGGG
ncbi:hypothetical protein, partial [Cerasicoccus arenae]